MCWTLNCSQVQLNYNISFEFNTSDVFILSMQSLVYQGQGVWYGWCLSRISNTGDAPLSLITIGQAFLGSFHVVFDDPNNQICLGVSMSSENTAINGPWIGFNPNYPPSPSPPPPSPHKLTVLAWCGIVAGSVALIFGIILLAAVVKRRAKNKPLSGDQVNQG
jgi:hypothetical protein